MGADHPGKWQCLVVVVMVLVGNDIHIFLG